MWTICRPVCSTLSHRDSPVLDSRPLLSCSPHSPFCLISHPPPRPLTFYHHNRYIIPRSVFYSRVTPWNAFVRDIVRLSLSLSLALLPLFPFSFPPSSFFFPAGYLIGEIAFFPLFSMRRIFRDTIMVPRLLEIIARG